MFKKLGVRAKLRTLFEHSVGSGSYRENVIGPFQKESCWTADQEPDLSPYDTDDNKPPGAEVASAGSQFISPTSIVISLAKRGAGLLLRFLVRQR